MLEYFTASSGGYEFSHESIQNGGIKYPTKDTLRAHDPQTGEQAGELHYYPPKRKKAPVHVIGFGELDYDRKRGAGSALLDEMESRHPGSRVVWMAHLHEKNKPKPGDPDFNANRDYGLPTDWDTHYPKLPGSIHRGIGISLSPGEAGRVNDPSRPAAEQAKMLYQHVKDNGSIGMHWSADPVKPHQFAFRNALDPRTDVPVVLHAQTPDRKDIETRPDILRNKGVWPHEHISGDAEVPIRKRKQVMLTGISWLPDVEHPEADENGWVHHTFEEPMRHFASVERLFPTKMGNTLDADINDYFGGGHGGTAPERRVAGRGKPRRDGGNRPAAPGAGGGGAPAGQQQGEAADAGGAAPGPRPVEFHPQVAKDLRALDKPVQKQILGVVDSLATGDPNLQTHALTQKLSGWYSTKASRGHRIVHRPTDEGGIHVGYIGLHDYDKAIRRLTKLNREPGPVTFPYLRNTERAPDMGSMYDQDIEPHGRYLTYHDGPKPQEGRWETGEVSFENPLHLDFGGNYGTVGNWKHRLSKEYGGRKGKALSRAVVKAGHDAIITHDEYGPSEIVDLTSFQSPRKRAVKVAKRDVMQVAPYLGDTWHDGAAEDFRRVVFTSPLSQFTVMTLQPGEEIGAEVHEDVDQILMLLSGRGRCLLNEDEMPFTGNAVLCVPRGNRHNVMNGDDGPMRLATVYAPAHHAPGTVHHTKEDAKRDKTDEYRKTAEREKLPLPERLYHVTTAVTPALEEGLKTREELHQQYGHGLGGGPNNTISLTTHRPTAEHLLHSLHEYHDVLNGKITPDDLIDKARNGVGAQHPYEDMVRGGNQYYERAKALEGDRTTELGIHALGEQPEGWEPAGESQGTHHKTGQPIYLHWSRPVDPKERIKARSDLYKNFTWARQFAKGHMDPLFVQNDPVEFAKKDPSEFSLLEVRPKPGAKGIRMNDRQGGTDAGEWRALSGKDLDVTYNESRDQIEPRTAAKRQCGCCGGVGEHGMIECYACDSSGTQEGREIGTRCQRQCPCGQMAEFDPQDGWQHLDGSVTHDDPEGTSVSDLMKFAAHPLPTSRVFGPTYGLDHRLFTGEKLKPEVRTAVMARLGPVIEPVLGDDWQRYTKVYLAGSEASEWTSATLEGNGDFDTLIGVDYDHLKGEPGVPVADLDDQDITDALNKVLREGYNASPWKAPFGGDWDLTGYCNAGSYDIRKIKPYAAYNITDDEWSVRPPHLPDWSIDKLPEGGQNLLAEAEGYAAVIEAISQMPEPFRTQQGKALWHHLHTDRGRAFSDNGEGWLDPGNLIEKALVEWGLWDKLVEWQYGKKTAVMDPSSDEYKAAYDKLMSGKLWDDHKEYCPTCKTEHTGFFEPSDHERSYTDWDKYWDRVPSTIHRGMAAILTPDQHRVIHDHSRSTAERGKAVLDAVASQPIGMHWSASGPEMAGQIAEEESERAHPGDRRKMTHVILHADKPKREHVETDIDRLVDHSVISYPDNPESEVPLKENAPVTIRGVSWKHPSEQEWHSHEFEQPIKRTSSYEGVPVAHVRVDKLWPHREWDHQAGGYSYDRDGGGPYAGKHDAQSWERNRQSVAEGGIEHPITLEYNPKAHSAYIGEGNHRLHWARELGQETVPVRVWRTSKDMHPRYNLPGAHRLPEGEHIPQELDPRDVLPEDWFPAQGKTAGANGDLPELTFKHLPPEQNHPYGGADQDTHTLHAYTADGQHAGELSWFGEDGMIRDVGVPGHLRRRGVASELLRRARQIQPGVHHSDALTSDGAGWARKVSMLEYFTASAELEMRTRKGKRKGISHTTITAYSGDRKAGHVRMTEGDTEVDDLHVVPAMRGKGVGRALMNEVIDRFGHQPLRLHASPFGSGGLDKDALQAFYASHGFEPEEDRGPDYMVRRPGKTAVKRSDHPLSPDLPEEQADALGTEDYTEHKRKMLDLAKNPVPGTHIWRGELRADDPVKSARETGVGIHWGVNPDTIVRPQAGDGEHEVVYHAEIEDPEEQTFPRSHSMWRGRHMSMDSEAEVRLKPGSRVKLHGVWYRDPYVSEKGYFTPTKPERMGKQWSYTPINEYVQVAHRPSNGLIDYSDVGVKHEGVLEYFTAAEEDEDYRMQHRPADEEYGAPLHDLTHGGMLPEDVYTHPQYYDYAGEGMGSSFGESYRHVLRTRGKPEAKVKIYRSLPAEHAHQGFRPGDWVSTSKEYARQHGMQSDSKHDWPVISTVVPAKHLWTEGNDLREYGYTGPHKEMPMVSYKGGYHQEIRTDPEGWVKVVKRRTPKTADYRLQHRAPDEDSGRPYHHYFGGDEDEPVRIYRAAPPKVDYLDTDTWVTTDPDYAHQHAEQYDGSKKWPVMSAEVPAKHLYWDENDSNEFGYQGPKLEDRYLEEHDQETGLKPLESHSPQRSRPRSKPRLQSAWGSSVAHLSPQDYGDSLMDFTREHAHKVLQGMGPVKWATTPHQAESAAISGLDEARRSPREGTHPVGVLVRRNGDQITGLSLKHHGDDLPPDHLFAGSEIPGFGMVHDLRDAPQPVRRQASLADYFGMAA